MDNDAHIVKTSVFQPQEILRIPQAISKVAEVEKHCPRNQYVEGNMQSGRTEAKTRCVHTYIFICFLIFFLTIFVSELVHKPTYLPSEGC